MRKTRLLPILVGIALAGWTGMAAAADGQGDGGHMQHMQSMEGAAHQGGHSHEKCELHGGSVTMTEQHHFETVFTPDGIRIYEYTGEQAPAMVNKTAAGTVKLVYKDGKTEEIPLVSEAPAKGEKAVYFCPMHANVVKTEPGVCDQCGGMTLFTQNRLFAKADLSKAEPGSLQAIVHITGLKGSEPEVTFTETNAAPAAPTASAPAQKG